jgi:hypothetical protein
VIRVYVEGIGLHGEGLDGWEASAAILAGREDYRAAPVNIPPTTLLPANERRRMVKTVKLALAVGVQAFTHAGRDPKETATIFASSGGDNDTVHEILESLAAPQIEVSPTRFHNSVHNAPSGYWSIATGSSSPTSSLCMHDNSFAAGLLDAAAQAVVDQQPVGLIAYDLPYPEPLNAVRRIASIFGVGLVIASAPSDRALASVTLAIEARNDAPTAMTAEPLEAIRRGNPAARSLPLLEAIARGADSRIVLDYLSDRCVMLAIAPCLATAAP